MSDDAKDKRNLTDAPKICSEKEARIFSRVATALITLFFLTIFMSAFISLMKWLGLLER